MDSKSAPKDSLQIHKACSEHGVEALWTGQKNILLSCPKMPRLHARSRLYELGVLYG